MKKTALKSLVVVVFLVSLGSYTTLSIAEQWLDSARALLVADGPEPVPPTAVLIADGPEPVPPTAVLIADGPEPVPPTAVLIA
ncbi:MAG: hypothetical protein L0338_14645, partial [Acidobacteria bacterium]|nr:hypothetical protein [Acidobacteriota bacterium]